MHTPTPEEKQLNFLIEEQQKNIEVIKRNLKAKTKELDTAIMNDNENLFGERKSEPDNVVFLFSERVNTSQRDKIIQPIKNALKTAENELIKLQSKKDTLTSTGTLF